MFESIFKIFHFFNSIQNLLLFCFQIRFLQMFLLFCYFHLASYLIYQKQLWCRLRIESVQGNISIEYTRSESLWWPLLFIPVSTKSKKKKKQRIKFWFSLSYPAQMRNWSKALWQDIWQWAWRRVFPYKPPSVRQFYHAIYEFREIWVFSMTPPCSKSTFHQ